MQFGEVGASIETFIEGDINCSVDLRSTAAVGDRRYNQMHNDLCRSV